MEHGTRRSSDSREPIRRVGQNRLLLDLKWRSQNNVPQNVSMFGDSDLGVYYRNNENRREIDRRLQSEMYLRRAEHIPNQLAEQVEKKINSQGYDAQ